MSTLEDLNIMNATEFVTAMGEVFENSPWVAEQVVGLRPFQTKAKLHAAMVEAVANASRNLQLSLIQAHPDLAGKAAQAKKLTTYSTKEQAFAGLDQLSDEEFLQFERLNTAYRAKFGFPFIICVRKTNKIGIFHAYEERLKHDIETERKTALAEIGEIARLRLEHIIYEK